MGLFSPSTVNITNEISAVISVLIENLPVFSHIDQSRLAVFLAKARKKSRHGIYAKVIGRNEVPPGYHLSHFPREVLYALYFYWPRFIDASFEEKVNVICHELYHISDAFDGKMRRIGTRLHGASRAKFEEGYRAEMLAMLTRDEVASRLDRFKFLSNNSEALSQKFKVVADFYRLPKLVAAR